jgi:hypothetical protein
VSANLEKAGFAGIADYAGLPATLYLHYAMMLKINKSIRTMQSIEQFP